MAVTNKGKVGGGLPACMQACVGVRFRRQRGRLLVVPVDTDRQKQLAAAAEAKGTNALAVRRLDHGQGLRAYGGLMVRNHKAKNHDHPRPTYPS